MSGYRETTTEMWVRPNDLDSLGHVNNASVLELLENGRWHWLACNLDSAPNPRVVAVVARMEIDYRRMIVARRVRVQTLLESAPEPGELGYRVVFSQRLYTDTAADTAADTTADAAAADSTEAVKARVEVGFFHTQEARLATVDEFFQYPEEATS